MEKIRAALEMFKQQVKEEEEPLRPALSASIPQGWEPIVYTRTRTVEVSPEVLRERRVLTALEEGPFTDAYKILRTQILRRMNDNGWNVLAMTSPGAGEGKTLTAVNLAVSMAMETGRTVLLVDANLRGASLHEFFGIGPIPGLVDYLLDDVPVEDLLIHPNIERLILLPGGRRISNSAELLTSPKMISLVRELKHRYASRIVIFDLPPLLSASDVMAFSPYTDAAVLVVEAGRTQTEEIERALYLLKGVPLIGTVLNKG